MSSEIMVFLLVFVPTAVAFYLGYLLRSMQQPKKQTDEEWRKELIKGMFAIIKDDK